MTSMRYSATHSGSGAVFHRESSSRHYTHAVVGPTRALSWHTRSELAEASLRTWVLAVPEAELVAVTVSGPAAEAKAAGQAGLRALGAISNQISRQRRALHRALGQLARWESTTPQDVPGWLIAWGEARTAELITEQVRRCRADIDHAESTIERLTAERDRLLAAKGAGR